MTQRAAVRAVALVTSALVLGGCGDGVSEDVFDQPATSTTPDAPSTSGASPGRVGLGARCPATLPQSGLPGSGSGTGADSRLVGATPPGQVVLCRYEQQGTGFRWGSEQELPSADRDAIVDDLRSIPASGDVMGCAIAPDPTPFVLVMAMPNDAVQVVRADADPTCAYATALTTNGAGDFAPIGNDLLETWESGRWEGVSG